MVTTRARTATATIAEEKKDDDEYTFVAADPPESTDGDGEQEVHDSPPKNNGITSAESKPSSAPKAKRPLLLLLCASGITSCYLWYGAVQEQVYRMDAADEEGATASDDKQSITLFMLATGTFSSFLLALIWTVVGPILLSAKAGPNEDRAGRINHPLIVLTSLTYLSAMAASNESLHYVSYPTCVLAKSSKLIPTMLVGWIVEQYRSWRSSGKSTGGGKSVNAMEWIGAALITAGILSFQYIQLQKNDKDHDGTDQKGDSPYGLALLGLSLFMDGLLGACQSTLKQKSPPATGTSTAYRPPSAMETMLYLNLYATILLLIASHRGGQLQRGMDVLFSSNDDKSMLLAQLNLSAALGQVFIFLTIHHFSPLTCTTITTTRKFMTILLSVYRFGHVLNVWQWASIGLVFGGLYLEIVAKLFERPPQIDSDKEKKD